MLDSIRRKKLFNKTKIKITEKILNESIDLIREVIEAIDKKVRWDSDRKNFYSRILGSLLNKIDELLDEAENELENELDKEKGI